MDEYVISQIPSVDGKLCIVCMAYEYHIVHLNHELVFANYLKLIIWVHTAWAVSLKSYNSWRVVLHRLEMVSLYELDRWHTPIRRNLKYRAFSNSRVPQINHGYTVHTAWAVSLKTFNSWRVVLHRLELLSLYELDRWHTPTSRNLKYCAFSNSRAL